MLNVQLLDEQISNLLLEEIDQRVIDDLAEGIRGIFMDAASSSGLISTVRHRKQNARDSKAWFDESCRELRKEYMDSKKKYKSDRSVVNKLAYNELGRRYKMYCRKTKFKYQIEFNKKLQTLKSKNSRQYWKLLNQGKTKKKSSISTEEFMRHFEKLSFQNIEDRDSFDPSIVTHSINEDLNKPFTVNELAKQVKKLKVNKAHGKDDVLNEFLKYSPPQVIEMLTKFFNSILLTGFVPEDWTTGLILPLYKGKGSVNETDNYRGITLLSCVGKLFTAVINDRLQTFLDNIGGIGDEQAGFRRGYATIDHIFVLSSIINIYLHKKKRLYCTFVDYQKAFDLVDRSSLWMKLLSLNINGKILTVVHNMYAQAKSCVLVNGKKSNLFHCNIGVRQGENLSPLLFAIFLNDFNQHLSKAYKGLNYLSELVNNALSDDDVEMFFRLFCLLYAGDTIVLAESPEEMQLALNAVKKYCDNWFLNINVSKTKVVIFAKGVVRVYPQFYFGEHVLEVVQDYVYLGTLINYNGRFKKGKNRQVQLASRALFSLREKCLKLNLSIPTQLELFDKCIVPILLYGCEIWGYENVDQLETFHHKFLKRLLGVRKSTANCIVRGELGRMELRKTIDLRMLNYWCKIINSSDSKLNKILYKLQQQMFSEGIFKSLWLEKIKSILDRCGLSYIWGCESVDQGFLGYLVNLNLIDRQRQDWHANVLDNGLCSSYRLFKQNLELENYISNYVNPFLKWLCKFRCGGSNIPVNSGRFIQTPFDERICSLCDTRQLGDEYHYLLECSYFQNQRNLLIPNYYRVRPSVIKFTELLSSKSLKIQTNVSKLCKIIMCHFQ